MLRTALRRRLPTLSDVSKGALYITLAAFLFSLMSTLVRVASDDAPSAAAFRIRPGAVSVFLEAWHRAGVAARGPEAGA